ncbi:RHS repeat protein [Sphingomonas paucimobilis]|uniref:RHS repeat protein n=1 Tax=Sphingomonas paucimobilis TaxID=13689 RepID=UPI001600A7DB|nr:RHS repeat protein [Sphingomonas paucimobilis]
MTRRIGWSVRRPNLIDGVPQAIADVGLRYDDKGRLVAEEQNGIAVTYRYDEAGRCVGRTSPSGETSLSFDEAGLLRRYESNGHALRFAHDASGLETLREAAAIGVRTAFQLTRAYDPAGRLAEQRAGGVAVFSGTPPAPGELVRHYDWDRAGRLAGIRDAGASGLRGETRFHHDLRDQTVAVERPGAHEAYRYDALMNRPKGWRASTATGATAWWRRGPTASATMRVGGWSSVSCPSRAFARAAGVISGTGSTG